MNYVKVFNNWDEHKMAPRNCRVVFPASGKWFDVFGASVDDPDAKA